MMALSRVILENEAKKLREEYKVKNKEVAEKRSRLQKQIELLEVEISKLTVVCRGLKRGMPSSRRSLVNTVMPSGLCRIEKCL